MSRGSAVQFVCCNHCVVAFQIVFQALFIGSRNAKKEIVFHCLDVAGNFRNFLSFSLASLLHAGAAYSSLEAATGRALLRQHMDNTGEDHPLNKLRVKIEPGLC